jgi:MGT family glycosyltransferase
MARLLAYTSPGAGHVFPLVAGLLELQRRGHTVHVRTSPAMLAVVREAGLDGSPVDPRILEVESDDYLQPTGNARIREGLKSVIERGRLDGPDLDAAIAEFRPDALIVDCNAFGAMAHAEASGLPWALSLPSLLPLREAGIPPYSLALRPARGPLGRLRDAVLWPVVERAFGKAILPGINGLRREAGLPDLGSPLDQYRASDLVLALTSEPLEYPRKALPGSVRVVGFQPWDPPAAEPAFLAAPGDPWVLVTCSTEYQGDEALAVTAVEALRDEPVRVLLTLGEAYGKAALPDAPNVTAVDFVPHAAAMARAAVVVTHTGMGTVGKAAFAGIPIVAVPFGRDQPEIARRVTEAGLGVSMPAAKLTPERLRNAVRKAAAARPRAEAVAARLRATDPARAFADAVDELVPVPAPVAEPVH